MKVPEKREDITLEWLNRVAFAGHGIQVHNFTFTGDASNGRGYMGTLERMELEISRSCSKSSGSDREDMEKLEVILKTLPNDPFRKSFAVEFSSRELTMYTEIFKVWDEFLDSRQVPGANRFRHPNCYYGAEEGEGDTYRYILILENLTAKKGNGEEADFHLWPGGFHEPLPWKEVTSVIRQIARFHATGIAYKIENHAPSDNYYRLFPKLCHTVSPSFQFIWDNAFKIAKEVVENTLKPDEIPEGLFKQLDKLCEDQQLLANFFLDTKMIKSNINTILHHDLHSNNMVFTADQSDVTIFDYQACCVMNPMKDLSFFMVLNCSTEDQTTNLPAAMQVYHEEFERTMKAINLDFQYPLEHMKRDYDWYLVFTLTHIMTGGQIWFAGNDLSEKRFTSALLDAYTRGVLQFPTHEP